MAHRSKKKHLKHVHEHEPATPPAKSPVEKAEAAAAGIAQKGGAKRRAASAKAAAPRSRRPSTAAKPGKKKGLVRRLAGKATRTLIAKVPRPSEIAGRATERIAQTRKQVVARAKRRVKARVSRVKSMFGAEAY